ARCAAEPMAASDEGRHHPGSTGLARGRGLAAQRDRRRYRAWQRPPHLTIPDQPRRRRERGMNWLERERRELQEKARERTANTAERTPMAVTAVGDPAKAAESVEALRTAWEERAAILEFDNGLTRDEAERVAWLSIYGSRQVH